MNQIPLYGVLYAEDFDEDGEAHMPPADAPEPEVIEPSFTAAEVEAAREAGRAAGRMEAERGLNAGRSHMLGLIAAGMEGAREAGRQVAEEAAAEAARCMMTALCACLPALCSRYGAAELRAFARAVLPALHDEPRITVRVHPQMQEAMQAEVDALDPDIAEHVRLVPTDAVAAGDARVSWTNGHAVRHAARTREMVEEAFSSLGLLEPTEPTEREMADA